MSKELEVLRNILYIVLTEISEKEIPLDRAKQTLKLVREMRNIVSKCIEFECTEERYKKIISTAYDLIRTILPEMSIKSLRVTMGVPEYKESVWIETENVSEMIDRLKDFEEVKRTLNIIEQRVTTIIELERKPLIPQEAGEIEKIMKEIEDDLVKEGVILNSEDREILALIVEKLLTGA